MTIALALLCAISIASAGAFNVDTVNYVRHDGPSADSMYGFTVAVHREKQKSWVLIGAPRADTSHIQKNVYKGGAVYRCDTDQDNHCWLIPFDMKGMWYNEDDLQLDTKSNQWFGATLASAGIDGPVVACAPRYVFHTTNPKRHPRLEEPVGTCFVARDDFQSFTEFSPCRTHAWGYHRQGSCQAGFSAAITNDRLFVGAPGSWYWQGQEYSINNKARYPFWPAKHAEYGEGQTFSRSLAEDKNERVYSTKESSVAYDDTYLGYSSASGDFNADGVQGVAIGMPRGGELRGKVLLYQWNMTNLQNITGEQIGAYFGYSMCVVDVDGDGLQDLIIGAPMYTEPNNEGKYEMGRVYVMFQGKYNKFQELVTRDGITSRGRFGLALSSLADINQDGYGDFAVGAPYDGARGRGAVYIFHGSPDGPLAKASQVIFAEDVMLGIGEPLSTFGFSVAGGIDLDGNMYPDLVVGAYESSKAITFKSRPVAVMEASTTFESESKLISLDERRCTVGRTATGEPSRVACTQINSCLRYNGVNLPPSIDIDVSWLLDARKYRSPRLFFVRDEARNIRNSTMRLYRGKSECLSEQVYINENIRDKLTPLEVEMRYNIRGQQASTRVARSLAGPVLDQNRGTVQRDAINIQKNCGPDNVCIPDLRLDIRTVDKYLLGSKDLLNVEVIVPNNGEDAFEAAFYMTVPAGINFRKMEKIGDGRDGLVTCTAPSSATNHTLKCDIGNPLPSGKQAHFKLVLQPSLKPGQTPSYAFRMHVNSTNAEADGTVFDNTIQKSIGIWVETDLRVTGVAVEPAIHYNLSEYASSSKNATHEDQLGPHIVNMFEIRNSGPSAIEEAEIYVILPHETLAGDRLMYLLNQPETSGNIQCVPTVLSNPLSLHLNAERERTSYLETQGAVERSSASMASHGTSSASAHGKLNIAESDFASASGDGSYIHQQRQHHAASGASASSSSSASESGSGAQRSWSSSSSSHSANGGPTVTYAASHNRSAERDANGQWRTVHESSTEHYSAGSAHQQQRLASQNRQQTSAGGGQQRISLVDIPSEGHISRELTQGSDRSSSFAQQKQAAAAGSDSSSSTGRRRMHSQQDGEVHSGYRHPLPVGEMERVAQGGSGGLQTHTLEVFGRNDVDEELRQRSASTLANHHQQHGSTAGAYEDANADGDDYEYVDGEYTESDTNDETSGYQQQGYASQSAQHLQQQHQQQQQHHSSSSSSASQSSNSQHQQQTNFGDRQFRHYPRQRRSPLVSVADLELNEALQCNRTRCMVIRCRAGPLAHNANAWLAIRARLVAETLHLIAPGVPMNLSTMVVARVSKLPFIGAPQEQPLRRFEVVTTAIPVPDPKPDVVPLWVVILSACAGVLILLLLIYLLYKCGFFNRNRPTDSQERQPLNRNTGYHGDEHL